MRTGEDRADPGDVGVLLVTRDLGVEQLELHPVHERSVVGVSEDGLVVDVVVVDEFYVTHAGRPVDIPQSPFDPEKEWTGVLRCEVVRTYRTL